MAESSLKIPKLQGSANWDIWALQIEAVLIEKGYYDVMILLAIVSPENELLAKKAISIIRLSLGDGPLLQTKTITSPIVLWNELKALYEPKGFSSEFLICRELFSTSLNHIPNKNMEAYLNKITRLVNDLKARDIAIPNQVIGALILSNLTKEYDYIVAIITAGLR